MRIDQLLVQQGLAPTRSAAQRLIGQGAVRWRLPGLDWQTPAKAGVDVPPAAQIELTAADELRYVSRGGLKLEGALNETGLRVQGLRCLDIGQSSGGFTDCLLQQGAAHVAGVDVGSGQLHPSLRSHPRVQAIEQTNARELTPALLQAAGVQTPFDLVVGDLSFISQTLVWPAIAPLMAPGGLGLLLVKPQFELQPGQIGKGGLVRDAGLYTVVRQRIADSLQALGLPLLRYFDSPITGGDGNREFFVFTRRPA